MSLTGPCKDCKLRAVGCHGKDDVGKWNCPRWEEYEQAEAKDLDKRKQSHIYDDYHRNVLAEACDRKLKGR